MSEVHILLVEDSHQDVELISLAIKEISDRIIIEVASDGDEALQFLYSVENKPTLILLDLNLPKKSGLEVLREIKRDSGLKTIPVIILTNSMSEDDVVSAYASHCNAYVRKPLGYDTLLDCIRSLDQFWFKMASLPKPLSVSSAPFSSSDN